MANKKPLYDLYKGLLADNYDVPDNYESFERTLTQAGKAGADSRHTLYEALKKNDYDVPEKYENFYSTLFEPVNGTTSRAKGSYGSALAQKQPQPAPATPAQKPAQAQQSAPTSSSEDWRRKGMAQLDQIVARTNAGVEAAKERLDNLQQYGVGLNNGETRDGGYRINPKTNAPEKTYLTPQGNRYSNKASADMESQEYRQMTSQKLGLDMNDQQIANVQKPADAVVATLWSEAEKQHASDREKNANDVYGGSVWLNGGREMHIVNASVNAHKNQVSHLTRFDLQKLMDNAWERAGKQMTSSLYAQLEKQYPWATDKQLRESAEAMAHQLSDNAVYKYAVAKNTPKSTLDFFAKTAADMNLLSSITKGLARSEAGTTGDMDAYDAAMQEYGKHHRIAQIGGTVVGMAFDPTTYIAGGIGSLVGKGAMNLAGRAYLRNAATGVGARLLSTKLGGRVLTGAAAGAGNLSAYEGIKEAENQFVQGGHINEQTGENEGYSAGDVLKSTLHGALLGTATGTMAPLLGNVSDKLVKATSNTAGKVGIRMGEQAVSTVAEGTIFSVPEWISGDRDAMDVWTDNLSMMLGFKGQHLLKSAPRVIAGMQPIANPKTMAERNHNRMSFVEKVRKQMDASPSDMAFTKEEREELAKYGYGDLAMLFTRTPKQPKKKAQPADSKVVNFDIPEANVEDLGKQWLENHPEFDGYEAMQRLIQDPNVSQAARAKAYYLLTGRQLPMGTVTGWTREEGENGIYVKSVTANGEVVTSRYCKDEASAKAEEDKIKRQAELNSIDVGERYTEAQADNEVMKAAIDAVAPGADYETVMRNYQAVKEGDADAKANYGEMMDAIDKFVEQNKGMADGSRPAAIRKSVNEEYGVDVDKAISKEPSKRTEQESEAVQDYIERLFPKQRGEGGQSPEEAEASAIYDSGRLLWGQMEQGDEASQAEAKAKADAIAQKVAEAKEACEQAFGTEADARMAELAEDPWAMVNNPELTEYQQDAVLNYIKAKSAQDGLRDASNESADNKRQEVENSVQQRTSKDTGMIQPATLKVKNDDGSDKTVYVVKGNVATFDDGTIDVRNSDQSIVIFDTSINDYRITSPDFLYSMGEGVDPQSEIDTAVAAIQAEHDAMLGGNAQNSGENVQNPAEGAPVAETEGTIGTIGTIGSMGGEEAPKESALSRVPIDEKTREPMFEQTDSETALDAISELTGGNEANAEAIINAQVEQANKAVEALKKKQPKRTAPKLTGSPMAMIKAQQEADANYNAAMEQYNAQLSAAEGKAKAWTNIWSAQTNRKQAALAQQEAERKAQDAKAHEEAVAKLAEDKRKAEAKAAEQEAVGVHAVNPKIKEKWDKAKKVDGNGNAITLADGSTLRGHYVLTEAGAASASHDAGNGFEPTEGFPIDKNGESVNDRDYRRDKDAQRIVQDIADNYDSRALQTPVVVSKDGVVLSGNNRTMSGEIAARQGTDKAYVDYLKEFGKMYGFTPEQIEGMEHPRVLFVADEDMPYDANTFARFNAETQKKQSKPEMAVKLGKTVPDKTFTSIASTIGRYDRLSDFYADQKAVNDVLGELHSAGVINEMQLPELRTGNTVSAVGRELIENALIGKVFQASPDAVRQIIATPTLRQSIMMALNEIAHNRTLAKSGYDLGKELGEAVDLVARAKAEDPDIYKEGVPVSPYGRQQGLFDEELGESRITDVVTLLLADVLNSNKPSDLRKFIASYNADATSAAAGQLDMFSGDVRSKEQILNDINNYFQNATPRELQERVDAAIAERKRNAEGGRGETVEQGKDTAGRNGESRNAETNEQGEHLRQSPSVEQGARRDGIRLTKGAVDALVSRMEEDAELSTEKALTAESWAETFDENNSTETPIGRVKMGEHQITKFFDKNRVNEFGMVGPTLKNPDAIIEEPSEAKDGNSERDCSFVFVKAFNRNGEKKKFYASITVKQDGMEVSISSHYMSKNALGKKMLECKVIHIRKALLPNNSEWHLVEHQVGVPDLLPTQGSNASVKEEKLQNRIDGGAQTERHPADVSVTTPPKSLQGKEGNALQTAAQKPHGGVSSLRKSSQSSSTVQGNGEKSAENNGEKALSEKDSDIAKGLENVKAKYPDKMFIVKDGKNYHLYGEDAKKAAEILDIDCIKHENPKLGYEAIFPVRALDTVLPKLIRNGHTVGIVGGKKTDNTQERVKSSENSGVTPLSEKIKEASADVNTEPTEAQKGAGNYKKGHVQVCTFDITIEQPEGSVRRGTDTDGKKWESKMHNAYGYFKGTEGVDGDHIDVFLSTDIDGWDGHKVFVVDQYNPDGTFDEHKVMLGFNDADEAKSDYLANYEKGWEKGRRIDVTPVNLEDFEKWIESSHRKTKPFAEYKGVKKADEEAVGSMGSMGEKKNVEEITVPHSELGRSDKRYLMEEGEHAYKLAVSEVSALHALTHSYKDELFERFKERYHSAVGDFIFKQHEPYLKDFFDYFEKITDKRVATEPVREHKADGVAPLTHEERVLRDAVVERMRESGIEVIDDVEAGQKVLDAANEEVKLEAKHHSESAEKRRRVLGVVDEATAIVSGKDIKDVRAERMAREAEYKEETRDLYEKVLSGKFDDVTLQRINEYLDHVTPNNEYGRPLSKRLPPEVVRRVRKGERTSEVDVLFSRICESAVPANERTRPEAKRRIEEKKKELLKAWAIATGNWHTSVEDFTHNTEPIGSGKDSVVYLSDDGKSVIKVSAGKDNLKKFRPDIDAVTLFNHIFRNSPYKILGYGEVDGKFVKFLQQPFVDFSDSTPLSAEERVAYMERMGFKPMNDEKTAFSNGKFVVADLQGNNIVKDKAGNIRVIDADVKLHTKDFGGSYEYPAVETDFPADNGKVRFFRTEDGEAYGFTMGNKVYIDPRIAGADTPIHEYTHLWAAALRKGNPKEWANVVNLMKGEKGLWEEVKKRYPDLKTDDELAEEVLSHYSGRRGAERLREEARKIAEGEGSVFEKAEAISALERVKRALDAFWKGVCDFLHIHYTSAEEVADRVMKDLLDGVDPRKFGKTDGGLRMSEDGEIKEIIAKAKADGTYMKAPNGKPSNLSPRQWAQVRTKAFKKWFGDWLKTARIEKLRKSEPVSITGEEYRGKYELNRDSAKAWIKDNLRGRYINEDTKERIEVRKDGAQKVTSHSMGNEAHLKSLVAIPELIEKSIFIEERPNEKDNGKYDSYRYYVCGLKIGGKDYTVKITVGVKGGSKYYDHALTEIEKGSLLDNIDALSTTFDAKETVNGESFGTTPGTNPTTLNVGKDTKLVSILQTNSSKVVDENGEPLVLIHNSTVKGITKFKQGIGHGIYFADAIAQQYVEGFERGENNYEVFLNIKNPYTETYDSAYIDAEEGTDGVLVTAETGKGIGHAAIVSSPNQIKSATDNVGTFDVNNNDIRFQFVGAKGAKAADHAEEVTTRLDNLAVAREMEEAKKDAKAIKMATGWERGADGKWRYEIPDGKIVENPNVESHVEDESGEMWYTTTLGDIYDAPEVYRAYPQLKTVQVVIQQLPIGTIGGYGNGMLSLNSHFYIQEELREYEQRELAKIESSPEFKAFSEKMEEAREKYNVEELRSIINDFENTDLGKRRRQLLNAPKGAVERFGDEASSVVAHEIQHAIQEIEGFAKGGNTKLPAFKETPEYKAWEEQVARLREESSEEKELNETIAEYSKEYNELFDRIEAFENSTATTGEESADLLNRQKEVLNELEGEINELVDKLEEVGHKRGEKVQAALDSVEGVLWNLYNCLAGEVESRNVQKRMGMTPEERRASLASETEDVAREDQIFLFGEGGESRSEERYSMGDAPETFEARQKQAMDNRGTVMPGLNDAEVQVVKDIPRHPYTGNIAEATEQAIDAAKKKYVPNGVPEVLHYDNYGEKFAYIISGNAIETLLSPKHQGTSVNKGVHLALVEHLDRVIANSIEVEEHPDRLKTGDVRDNENINPDALMHRFYGVARIDGTDYRVMTLMKEENRTDRGNGVHSYEVQKIEVLDEETPNTSNGVGTLNSELEGYPLAKVLKGVGKTMEKDKNLLAESKKVDEGLSTSRDQTNETAMVERVNELSERLNTPVRIVRTVDEVAQLPTVRQRKMKGSFNPKTGEVTIVVPNNANVADIENTFVHEVVGHDGLRVLFPEEGAFNNAMDELYRVSADGIKETIDQNAKKMYDAEVNRLREKKRKEHEAKGEDPSASYYADMAEAHVEASKKKDKFRRDATEEYGSDLAGRIGEEGFERMSAEEQTFWGKVKAILQKALQKLLEGLKISGHVKFGDKEWAFVLHEAYKRKKNGGRPSIFDVADTVAMRHKTGFGEEKLDEGHKKSAQPNEAALKHLEPIDVGHDAKVMQKRENAKKMLAEVAEAYKNTTETKGFLSDLCNALRLTRGLTGSGYGSFATPDGKVFTIRVSNHNVNTSRIGDEPMESIVIKTKRKPSRFKPQAGKTANEYVYFKEDIRNAPAGTLSKIAESISELLDTGEYQDKTGLAKHNPSPEVASDNDVMFRDGDDREYEKAMARDTYERRVARGMYQTQEALQDSMLGLKEAMEAVMKAEGKKMHIEEIADNENPYTGENALSSKNQADAAEFARIAFKPLLQEVSKLAKTADERAALTDYMMAKHGLERNDVMARRDAAKKANALFGADIRKAEYAVNKDPLDQDAADALDDLRQRRDDKEEELYLSNRGRDYAGLTALTKTDNVVDAEAEAQKMVASYEAAHDTTELWAKTKAVTEATLTKSYASGMIDRDTYNDIKGMYQNYIPLRGFDEKTSDEVYAYLNDRKSAFSAPIKTAKGRKSKADDPFANMEAQADSAIMQGNRNVLVKQRFLNFALAHPSDLVSVSDLWLRYDDVADEWKPLHTGDIAGTEKLEAGDSPAEVERKMQDFEAAVEQLSKSDPKHFVKQKERPDIPYRVIDTSKEREHQVIVKRNGKDYVLTINGNPRAAQALNGQTNPDNNTKGLAGWFERGGEWANRQLSALYTTRNPDFIVSNFIRDALYANTMTWIKESPGYAWRYNRNFAKVNPAKMKILFARLRNGELDMNDETDKLFYQFIMNGGETGYTNLRDIEKRKNDIKRELKKNNGQLPVGKAWDLLGERFDEYNRAVENCARFAAFITSRQMGRSVGRAIWDAKEISVNFNKKGSGSKFIDAQGQTKGGKWAARLSGAGRAGYVFWSAAVQGTWNFGKAVSRNPKKALTGVAAILLLGAINAALNSDDDDDTKNSYFNLPEYVRRSNIVFRMPWMKESWISIPLPVEYRSIYGMGELMASALSGKEHMTGGELANAIAGQASQMLPIDMLEGGGGWMPFVPSAAKPVAEVIANKSWTGMPIYKKNDWNKDDPEWTKAFKNANGLLVGASKWLNEVTGGDRYTTGMIDINPSMVEYLLTGYFGGVANTVNRMVKMGETMIGEREYDPKSFLILNRLVKNGDERTESRALNNEYYRLRDEHDKISKRLRRYENDTDDGVFDYAEKISELNNSPEYKRMEIFEEYGPDIDAIKKELDDVTLSDAERKELEQERTELMRELIDAVNESRKEQ